MILNIIVFALRISLNSTFASMGAQLASFHQSVLIAEANNQKNGVSCHIALLANSNDTKHDMLQATRIRKAGSR